MTCSRRAVVYGIGGAAVGGALAGGCARKVEAAPLLDLGAPVGCKLSVPVARLPDLAPAGGAVLVRATGIDPLLVVHREADAYSVYRGLCPHASCPLGVADGLIECPCHGSRFDPSDGTVLNPPAASGLQPYDSYLDTTTGDLVIALTSGVALPPATSGKLALSLADYPALANDYGTLAGGVPGCCVPLLITCLPGGQFTAVDPTCTHMACEVAVGTPDPARDQVTDGKPHLICPCHRSIFGFDGAVLQGPAAAPLAVYPASSDGVTLTVDLTAKTSCAG